MKFESDNYFDDNRGGIHEQYTEDQISRMEGCLDDLCKSIEPGRFCCASCGLQLPGDHANIYDHDGGWGLIGDVPKQWISFPCKCGYETSLNKMQHGLNCLLYKNTFKGE